MRRIGHPPPTRATTSACLAAALALAIGVVPVQATTLVVLVTGRAVIVGADSMRTLASGGRETVCKINHRDGVVFGFAGAVNAERFDAATVAAAEIARGGTLAELASRTAEALQAGLVAHFKDRDVVRTRRELVEAHRGRPVTGFVAGVVKGRPHVWLVMVRAEPAPDGVTLTTHVDQLDTKRPDRAVFVSPQHQDVIVHARERLGHKPRASVDDLVGAAAELVAMDVALDEQRAPKSRKSGPPTTVAVLDADGFRLVMPGECTTPAKVR
jgi:hypothetical protein